MMMLRHVALKNWGFHRYGRVKRHKVEFNLYYAVLMLVGVFFSFSHSCYLIASFIQI